MTLRFLTDTMPRLNRGEYRSSRNTGLSVKRKLKDNKYILLT